MQHQKVAAVILSPLGEWTTLHFNPESTCALFCADIHQARANTLATRTFVVKNEPSLQASVSVLLPISRLHVAPITFGLDITTLGLGDSVSPGMLDIARDLLSETSQSRLVSELLPYPIPSASPASLAQAEAVGNGEDVIEVVLYFMLLSRSLFQSLLQSLPPLTAPARVSTSTEDKFNGQRWHPLETAFYLLYPLEALIEPCGLFAALGPAPVLSGPPSFANSSLSTAPTVDQVAQTEADADETAAVAASLRSRGLSTVFSLLLSSPPLSAAGSLNPSVWARAHARISALRGAIRHVIFTASALGGALNPLLDTPLLLHELLRPAIAELIIAGGVEWAVGLHPWGVPTITPALSRTFTAPESSVVTASVLGVAESIAIPSRCLTPSAESAFMLTESPHTLANASQTSASDWISCWCAAAGLPVVVAQRLASLGVVSIAAALVSSPRALVTALETKEHEANPVQCNGALARAAAALIAELQDANQHLVTTVSARGMRAAYRISSASNKAPLSPGSAPSPASLFSARIPLAGTVGVAANELELTPLYGPVNSEEELNSLESISASPSPAAPPAFSAPSSNRKRHMATVAVHKLRALWHAAQSLQRRPRTEATLTPPGASGNEVEMTRHATYGSDREGNPELAPTPEAVCVSAPPPEPLIPVLDPAASSLASLAFRTYAQLVGGLVWPLAAGVQVHMGTVVAAVAASVPIKIESSGNEEDDDDQFEALVTRGISSLEKKAIVRLSSFCSHASSRAAASTVASQATAALRSFLLLLRAIERWASSSGGALSILTSIFPSNAGNTVSRTVPSEWAIGDDPIWGIQSVLAATKVETPAVSEALAHLAASQALARRSAVCVYVCLCILTCVPVDVDEVARVLATLPSLPHDAESMQCTPLSSCHAKELVRARARRVVKPLVRFSAALGNSCVPGATVLTSLSSAISALGAPVDVGFSGRLGAGEALEVWARRTALTDIPGLMVAAGIQSEKSLPTKPPQNGGKQRERRVRVYATAPFSWGGELRLKVRVVSAAKVSQLVPPRASIMLVENYVELWDTEAFLTPVLLASSSVTTPCSSPGPVGVGELWVAELRLPAVPPPTRSDSKTECASCPSNTESEYWYEISIISVTPAPAADPSRVSDVWPRAGEAALMHDSQSPAPVVVSALLTLSPQRIPDGTVATVVDVRLTSPTIFVSCPLLPLSSSLSLPVWLAGSPIEDHSKILPCHKWPSDRSCAASLTAAIISLARDVSSGHLHLHEALTFASSLFACASAVSVASAQSCLLDRAAALAEDTSDSSDVNFKMPVCSELKVVLFLTVASARTAIALARDPSARLPHCRLGAHAFMRSLARLSFCSFRSEPWDAVWLLEELPPSSISARRTLRVIVELVSCSSVRSLEPGTKASFPVWAAFLPLINALSIDLTTPDATRLRSTVFTAVCSSSARQITSASWMRVIAVADAAAEPALARARAAAAVSERLLHDDPILRDNDESLNYFGASRELQFGFSTQSDPTVALSSPGCPRLIRGEKALMFSLLPEKEFPLSSVLSSHFTTALDFLDAAGAGAWDIGSREPLSEVGSCEQHATCCPWMSIIHDASLKRSGAAIESELLLSSHIGRFLVLLPLSEWAGAVERLIAAAGAGAGCSSRARARAAARSVTVGAVRKLMSEAMKATHSSGNLISSWIDLISRVPDLFSESHADIILNTLAASESCHTPGTQILALVALNPDSICCTQAIQVLGQTHGLAWVTSMADAVAAGPEATIRTLGSAHEAAKVVRQNWAAAVVKLDATLARIVPHLISHTNTTSAVPLASIPQTAVETTLLLSSPAASKALANVFFSTNPVPSESFLHLCSGMIIADLKGPLSGVSSTTDAVCTVLSWMSSDASCLELAELCANSIAVAGRCITDTGLVLLQDVLSHVAFASEKLPSRALALSLESTATVAKLQRWNSVFNKLMPSKCTPAASLTASVPKTRKAVDRLDFITAIASVASGTNVENSIIAELTSASAAGLVICVGWDASPAQVAAILPLTAACAETSQANPSKSSLFNALIRGANSALFLSFLEKAAFVKLPNSKAVDILDIAKSSLVIAIDQAKEFLQAVCAGNLSPLHDVATPVILASECRRPSSARIVSADDQYSCRLLSSLADSIRYPLSLNICDSDIIAAVQASSTALTAARAVTSALPRVIPLLMSLSGQKGNYSGVTIAAAASHLLLHGSPTMSSLPVELSSLATTLSGGGDVPSALDKCDLSSVPAAASLYSSFVYLPRSHSAWLHEAVAYSDANNSNDILALLCSYVAEKEASSYRLEHRLALALCPPCKTKPTDLLGIGPAPASEAAAVLSALRNMLELLERLRGKLVAFVAHQGSPGADSQGAYFLSRAFSACTPSPTPASDFFVLTKHVNLVKSAIMDDHTASNEVLPLHDSLLTYFDGSRFESLLTHGEAFLVASDPFALRMRSPMLPKAGSEASCVARMSTAASIFRPSTIGSMTGEQVSLLGDPYVSMISDLSNALKSLQRRGASPSLAVLILSSPGIAAEEVSSNPLRFAVADTLEGKAVMGDEDLISVSADAATAPALAAAAKAVVSLWPDAIAAARAQLTWASGWSTPHVSFLATKIAEYVTEKPSSVSLTVSTLLARALESCGVSAALAVMTASNAHLVVQAATDATGGRSCVCLSSEELHTCVLTLAGAAGITNSVAPSGSNSAPTHVVVYSPLAPAAAAVHWALKKMKRLPAHGEVLDCRWVQSISSSVLTHLAASLPPTETRFILAPNALTASALRSLLLALKTTTATSQFFLFSSDIGWTIPRSALAGSFRSATIGRSGRDGVGETMKPFDSTELTSLLGPRFVPSSCLSDKAQKKSTRMSRPRALRVSTGNEEDQGVSNQSTVLGAASNPSQVDEAPSPATPFVQLRSLTAPTQQRRRTARFVTSQTPVAASKKNFASTAGVKPHPLEKPRISVATLTIAHRADAWAAAASCASRWRAVNVTAEMRATGADKSCQLSWFPPHPDAVVASGGIHNFSVYREPLVVPTAINGPRLLMVLDHEDNPLCGDAAAALLFADPLAPEQLRAMTPRAGDTLLLLTVSVEDRETDKSQPLFSFCLANSLTPSFRVSAIERLRQPLSVFFSSATLQPETIASATVSAGMSKRAHLLNDYLAAESTLWAERGSCPWSVAVILLATEISPDAEASWRAVAGDPTALLSAVPSTEQRQAAASFVTCISAASEQAYATKASLLTAAQIFAGVDARTRIGAAALAHAGVSGRHAAAALRLILQSELSRARGDPDAPWIVPNPMVSWWKDRARGDLPAALIVLPQTHPVNAEAISEAGGCIRQLQWTQSQPLFPHPLLRRDMALFSLCLLDSALSSPVKADSEGWSKKQFEVHRGLAAAQANVQDTGSTARSLKGKTDKQASLEHMCALFCVMGSLVETRENSKNESCVELRITLSAVPHSLVESWVRLRVLATGHSFAPTGQDVTCLSLALSSVHACSPGPFLLSSSIGVGGRVLAKFISKTAQVLTHRDAALDPEKGLSCKTSSGGPPPAAARLLSSAALGSWKVAVADGLPTSWLSWASDIASDSATSAAFVGSPCAHVFLSAAPQYEPFFLGQAEEKVVIQTYSTHPSADLSFITALSKSADQNPLLQGASSHIEALISGTYHVPENCGSPYPPDARVVPFVATVSRMCSFWSATSVIGAELLFMAIGNAAKSTKGSSGCLQSPLISNATRWPDAAIGAFVAPAISSALAYAHYHSQTSSNTGEVARAILFGAASFVANAGPMSHDACDVLWGRMSQVFAAAAASPEISSSDILVKQGISKTMSDIAASVVKLIESMVVGEGGWVKGTRNAAQTVSKLWFAAASLSDKATTIALRIAFAPAVAIDATDGAASDILDAIRIVCRATPKAAYQVDYLVMGACAAGSVGRTKAWLSERMKSQDSAKPTGGFHILWNACNDSSETGVPYGHVGLFSPPLDVISFMNSFHSPQKRLAIIYAPAPYRSRPLISSMSLALPLQEGSVSQTLSLGPTPFFDEVSSAADGILRRFLRALASGAAVELPRSVKEIPASGATGKMNSEWATLNLAADTGTVVTLTTSTLSNETEECVVLRVHGLLFAASCKVGCRIFIPTVSPSLYSTGGTHPAVQPPAIAMSQALFRSSVSGTDCNIEWEQYLTQAFGSLKCALFSRLVGPRRGGIHLLWTPQIIPAPSDVTSALASSDVSICTLVLARCTSTAMVTKAVDKNQTTVLLCDSSDVRDGRLAEILRVLQMKFATRGCSAVCAVVYCASSFSDGVASMFDRSRLLLAEPQDLSSVDYVDTIISPLAPLSWDNIVAFPAKAALEMNSTVQDLIQYGAKAATHGSDDENSVKKQMQRILKSHPASADAMVRIVRATILSLCPVESANNLKGSLGHIAVGMGGRHLIRARQLKQDGTFAVFVSSTIGHIAFNAAVTLLKMVESNANRLSIPNQRSFLLARLSLTQHHSTKTSQLKPPHNGDALWTALDSASKRLLSTVSGANSSITSQTGAATLVRGFHGALAVALFAVATLAVGRELAQKRGVYESAARLIALVPSTDDTAYPWPWIAAPMSALRKHEPLTNAPRLLTRSKLATSATLQYAVFMSACRLGPMLAGVSAVNHLAQGVLLSLQGSTERDEVMDSLPSASRILAEVERSWNNTGSFKSKFVLASSQTLAEGASLLALETITAAEGMQRPSTSRFRCHDSAVLVSCATSTATIAQNLDRAWSALSVTSQEAVAWALCRRHVGQLWEAGDDSLGENLGLPPRPLTSERDPQWGVPHSLSNPIAFVVQTLLRDAENWSASGNCTLATEAVAAAEGLFLACCHQASLSQASSGFWAVDHANGASMWASGKSFMLGVELTAALATSSSDAIPRRVSRAAQLVLESLGLYSLDMGVLSSSCVFEGSGHGSFPSRAVVPSSLTTVVHEICAARLSLALFSAHPGKEVEALSRVAELLRTSAASFSHNSQAEGLAAGLSALRPVLASEAVEQKSSGHTLLHLGKCIGAELSSVPKAPEPGAWAGIFVASLLTELFAPLASAHSDGSASFCSSTWPCFAATSQKNHGLRPTDVYAAVARALHALGVLARAVPLEVSQWLSSYGYASSSDGVVAPWVHLLCNALKYSPSSAWALASHAIFTCPAVQAATVRVAFLPLLDPNRLISAPKGNRADFRSILRGGACGVGLAWGVHPSVLGLSSFDIEDEDSGIVNDEGEPQGVTASEFGINTETLIRGQPIGSAPAASLKSAEPASNMSPVTKLQNLPVKQKVAIPQLREWLLGDPQSPLDIELENVLFGSSSTLYRVPHTIGHVSEAASLLQEDLPPESSIAVAAEISADSEGDGDDTDQISESMETHRSASNVTRPPTATLNEMLVAEALESVLQNNLNGTESIGSVTMNAVFGHILHREIASGLQIAAGDRDVARNLSSTGLPILLSSAVTALCDAAAKIHETYPELASSSQPLSVAMLLLCAMSAEAMSKTPSLNHLNNALGSALGRASIDAIFGDVLKTSRDAESLSRENSSSLSIGSPTEALSPPPMLSPFSWAHSDAQQSEELVISASNSWDCTILTDAIDLFLSAEYDDVQDEGDFSDVEQEGVTGKSFRSSHSRSQSRTQLSNSFFEGALQPSPFLLRFIVQLVRRSSWTRAIIALSSPAFEASMPRIARSPIVKALTIAVSHHMRGSSLRKDEAALSFLLPRAPVSVTSTFSNKTSQAGWSIERSFIQSASVHISSDTRAAARIVSQLPLPAEAFSTDLSATEKASVSALLLTMQIEPFAFSNGNRFVQAWEVFSRGELSDSEGRHAIIRSLCESQFGNVRDAASSACCVATFGALWSVFSLPQANAARFQTAHRMHICHNLRMRSFNTAALIADTWGSITSHGGNVSSRNGKLLSRVETRLAALVSSNFLFDGSSPCPSSNTGTPDDEGLSFFSVSDSAEDGRESESVPALHLPQSPSLSRLLMTRVLVHILTALVLGLPPDTTPLSQLCSDPLVSLKMVLPGADSTLLDASAVANVPQDDPQTQQGGHQELSASARALLLHLHTPHEGDVHFMSSPRSPFDASHHMPRDVSASVSPKADHSSTLSPAPSFASLPDFAALTAATATLPGEALPLEATPGSSESNASFVNCKCGYGLSLTKKAAGIVEGCPSSQWCPSCHASNMEHSLLLRPASGGPMAPTGFALSIIGPRAEGNDQHTLADMNSVKTFSPRFLNPFTFRLLRLCSYATLFAADALQGPPSQAAALMLGAADEVGLRERLWNGVLSEFECLHVVLAAPPAETALRLHIAVERLRRALIAQHNSAGESKRWKWSLPASRDEFEIFAARVTSPAASVPISKLVSNLAEISRWFTWGSLFESPAQLRGEAISVEATRAQKSLHLQACEMNDEKALETSLWLWEYAGINAADSPALLSPFRTQLYEASATDHALVRSIAAPDPSCVSDESLFSIM